MSDTIIYTLVSKGGGIDGRDHTDKGGNVTHAFFTREDAEKCPNKPWNDIKPVVVDLKEMAEKVIAGIGPIERLALAENTAMLHKLLHVPKRGR